MISVNVWQGIDYLAFHENAILLDVKQRSQGDPIRSVIHNDMHLESQDGLAPQLIRNVLDDFALVVAGSGGKKNVSAVCMEHDAELRMITLRISSNDGIREQKLADLQGLLQLITTAPDVGTEVRCEEVLTLILDQCATVFLKHVGKFLNELKQAGCPADRRLRCPDFSTQSGTAEPPADVDQLGPYNGETHGAYMQLNSDRLRTMRNISIDLGSPNTRSDVSKMVLLAKAVYNVQRSNSFDRFLRHNILASQRPMVVQLMAQSLKERLGKMSRLWRAAKTLTAFGSAVMTYNVTVNVLCLPASRHTVHELRKRTPAQLQARGGPPFRSCNDGKLQEKLAQWESYRVHCEMQLALFYQENPHLQLRSRYIGCNKLACYLCYSFLTNHGQFQVKGCHQALYSLWTVPLTINFEKHERAIEFSRALRQLAYTLESKVDTIRRASKPQWKYKTNHESTADLSRISLQWPTIIASIIEPTTEASDIRESRQLSQPQNPSRGHDYSDGDQKKRQVPSTHVQRNGSATQSPQNKALDHVPSPASSTTKGLTPREKNVAEYPHELCSNTENDLGKKPSWQLYATLPASTDCKNVPAAAVTSTVPPSEQPDIGRKYSPMISWAQNSAPARASQEIGQPCPTTWTDSANPVPQTSVSGGEKQCSQRNDRQGTDETSSPAQRQRQVRLCTNLFYEQNFKSAHIIGDHESRASDMPSKHGMCGERPNGHFTMPCLDGMGRTFDFHEYGLILEIECPGSAQVTVVQCSRPQTSKVNLVVEVDKIEPGGTIEIDTGDHLSNPRVMFLTKRDSKGIDQWLECRW